MSSPNVWKLGNFSVNGLQYDSTNPWHKPKSYPDKLRLTYTYKVLTYVIFSIFRSYHLLSFLLIVFNRNIPNFLDDFICFSWMIYLEETDNKRLKISLNFSLCSTWCKCTDLSSRTRKKT